MSNSFTGSETITIRYFMDSESNLPLRSKAELYKFKKTFKNLIKDLLLKHLDFILEILKEKATVC